jgi:cell division protein FtsN
MKFTKVIALALVATASAAGAQAQNLRNADEPAEFPPSSFNGTQYVDSRGCVFVRAGISGDVSWIPRVTRSRNQICNQKPSLPNAVTSVAPKRKPVAEPVQITLDTPKSEPAAAQAATPTVKTVVKAKPVPAEKPVVRKPVAVAEVAKPVVVATPVAKPTVAKTRVDRTITASNCLGGQKTSGKLAVRCGPQKKPHYYRKADVQTATAPASVAPEQTAINNATRIVPKHVYINRQNTQNLPVPKGYARVWNDGRLNPKRAEQSVLGQAQVRLIWTQTVPRRLIDTSSGRDVTASTPLVYPFVDAASQSRDLGSVEIVRRDGQVVKRVVRNTSAVQVRDPVVSSRSAPVKAPKVQKARSNLKAATTGFVNVGTFGGQKQAQSAAKRIQRMGFPVRIGKFERSGKTYRMVLAGPFGAEAPAYLKKLRSAGYGNATLR